ncbi:MAG: XRE family transcriptional regulator [Thermomicrobiales bacterium]
MALTMARTATANRAADDAAQVIAEAHQRAVEATSAEMAAHLQEVFGQNLTALMAGVENPKTVSKWVRGQSPHPNNLSRLRNAFHVTTFLELTTSRQTAQSWFMGMNPYLDDRAPALVLADEPEEASRVLRAARAFLAHG